jgi:drug/metabolite transporter (DMT)-like permease
MKPTTRAQLQIHFCVLMWGFTAILGKLISLPALPLVWWRMLIVTAILVLVPRVWRAWSAMSWRLIGAYAATGVLVALHWLTFYGAIKLANASVAATCMAIAPAFLSIVEPIVAGRRFDPRELLLGIAMVPGVALVVGGVPGGMRTGIAVGALSALLVAIFGAYNKRLVAHADPLAVTAIELGAGVGLLTLLAPFLPHTGPSFVLPTPRDSALLATLSIACTLLPFTLSLVALRHLSAFATQLAVNLEPVYTILIASAALGERRELTPQFYAGVAVILGVVLAYPILTRRGSAPPHVEVLSSAESKGISD